MRTRKRLPLRAFVALPVISLLPVALAHADGFAFRASAAGGSSDNVTRSATDEVDETIASVGLKMSYDGRSRHTEADIVSDLAYYDYLDGTYDSEVIGNFIGNGAVTLAEERLRLFVSDNFGQVLNDPFLPPTPENRENLNYLTTGFGTTFQFGQQTRLNFGATYGLSTYEISPLNASQVVGDLGLTRMLANEKTLGLNVRAADVKYEEDGVADNDYRQSEVFGRYTAEGFRTRLSADLGYSSLDREMEDTEGDFLLRLDLSRRLSARSMLTVNLGQEFSNSAEAFASMQAGQPVNLNTSGSQQTAQPFTFRHASLGVNLNGGRTTFDLGVYWQEHIYEDLSGLDQSLNSVRASARRDLSPTLNVQLSLEYGRGDFGGSVGDYTDRFGDLALEWRMTRSLSLNLSYDYAQRDGAAVGGGYTENRIWLVLGYQQGTPRTSQLRPDFAADAANSGD